MQGLDIKNIEHITTTQFQMHTCLTWLSHSTQNAHQNYVFVYYSTDEQNETCNLEPNFYILNYKKYIIIIKHFIFI